MSSPIAPRLITLGLVLAVGAALAVHGIHAPNAPGVALSGGQGSGPAATATSSSGSTTSPNASGSSSKGSSQASTTTQPASTKGTLLSSTQIAPFTYELYPTTASQTLQAESGFTITIKSAAGGQKSLDIQSAVAGGPGLQKTFNATDKVYWIETSFGDDGPGQDANYGDDAYILTDAQGYITQK
ncbi:MAG: hypothetical protein M0Z66_11785 [Thermaerobacter sp.]|nr:hypothetical protein [Thermaerobacter sp.]